MIVPRTLCVPVVLFSLLVSAGELRAAIITPDSATSTGMTFITGSPATLIDGDTVLQVFVNPFDTGSFIEFDFENSYQSDFIRLYNDFGADDDTLIEFNLDFFNGASLVAQEIGLVSPTSVAAHDIPFSTTIGAFDRVRLYPIVGQVSGPGRFQMREVQFNGSVVPEPSSLTIYLLGCSLGTLVRQRRREHQKPI